MRFLLFIILISAISCKDTQGHKQVSGPRIDLNGYDVETVNDLQIAIKRSSDGLLSEKIYLKDGVPHGAWITYHPDSQHPASMVTYVDGKQHGPSLTMERRGSLETYEEYAENVLEGIAGTYLKGYPTIITEFKQGEKHGTSKTFFRYKNDVQKIVQYKEGQIHGKFRQYNEDGTLLLDYTYDQGKKVDGGTVK